ncbi:MAG: BON domain-containing protein, partial [Janthinobacterium lividum]
VTRLIGPASILLLCLGLLPGAFAQTQATPDNSGNNRSQNQTQTADQGKNNKSDREQTAAIRRSIVGDKSISTYGHNVKIIVIGGAVTLKGPVHSEAEKQNIGNKAAQVVGADKVTNQITVKQ